MNAGEGQFLSDRIRAGVHRDHAIENEVNAILERVTGTPFTATFTLAADHISSPRKTIRWCRVTIGSFIFYALGLLEYAASKATLSRYWFADAPRLKLSVGTNPHRLCTSMESCGPRDPSPYGDLCLVPKRYSRKRWSISYILTET